MAATIIREDIYIPLSDLIAKEVIATIATTPASEQDTGGDEPTIDDLYEYQTTSGFPYGNSRYYLPRKLIRRLVTERMVCRELDESGEPYDDILIWYSLKDATKLFVIAGMVVSDRRWLLTAMKFFMENSFKDSDLSGEVGGKCLVKELLSKDDPELWGRTKAWRICEIQWQVLVLVISTEKEYYDFSHNVILPLTKSQTVLRGSFSDVSKVQIHEGHFEDPFRPVSGTFLSKLKR